MPGNPRRLNRLHGRANNLMPNLRAQQHMDVKCHGCHLKCTARKFNCFMSQHGSSYKSGRHWGWQSTTLLRCNQVGAPLVCVGVPPGVVQAKQPQAPRHKHPSGDLEPQGGSARGTPAVMRPRCARGDSPFHQNSVIIAPAKTAAAGRALPGQGKGQRGDQ